MASIEEQAKGKKDGEIRYLTPLNIETSKAKKYCRFKKSGIKYVDYKDPDFLLTFVNEQGKLLPEDVNRNIFEVPTKSRCCSKKRTSFGTYAICCRFIKIKTR